MHEKAWCATATLTDPDIVRSVHEDYIRAGARVVTTNTFSTNLNMLVPAGLEEEYERLNREAVRLAREARERTGTEDTVGVAGSMSHQIPRYHGRTDPTLQPSPEAARRNFRDMAGRLAEAGVDLILFEMMSDPDLANTALESARELGLPFWVGFSVRTLPSREIAPNARTDLTLSEMFEQIDLSGAGAAGIMHSKAHEVGPALDALREVWSGPFMVYPDSGYFERPSWRFVDTLPVPEFVEYVEQWSGEGVQILGACCGLGLDHFEALARTLGISPAETD